MKLVLEKPSPIIANELVMCEVVRGPDFGCVWHHHPEIELTWVRRGGTERWVGDKLTPLKPGDMALLGSDLPHDYRNDRPQGLRSRGVEAIVVQFMPNLLGDDWLRQSTMSRVRELFQRARRGLEITGRTRKRMTRILPQMVKAAGLRRIILLLELLECLENSRDLKEIASVGFDPASRGDSSDRIGPVCDHIEANLTHEIYLADLARLTGLSESAFSRLFRKSTGRTVPQYINELRIARACRLLAETDKTVGEITEMCGYPSPAHFQKQFQRFEHRSPLAYRAAVRGIR